MSAFPTFRADHVGSLLRPAELLQARSDFEAGKLDAAALRATEDDAIRGIVKLQETVGLDAVTDGEYRRNVYSDAFSTGGLPGVRVIVTDGDGWSASAEHGARTARRIPAVVDKIAWPGPQNATDFAFLKSVTTRTGKITLPGPAFIHYRAGRENISRDVYPNLDDFWTDIVAAYHQELRSLFDAGCRYVQIDETSLVKLGDPRAQQLLTERGDNWQDLLKTYVDVLNAVAFGAPEGMMLAIHVCRSQDKRWQADTSYEPIAEAMFNRLNFGAYLLEWNGPRAGSFEPLRHLPPGKRVVLGLLTSTSPEVENPDDIKRRIEDASRYAPLEQLALSPQCGFSTSVRAFDPAAYDRQRQKLTLIVNVAHEVWGDVDVAHEVRGET
jgi:5-methyltetrahydropteroyltriglutamate--homocysteine methyltransferase